MRLKVFTTGLMIFGLVALFGMPIFLGNRPDKSEGNRAMQEFAVQFGIYTIILVLVWLAVIVCAWFIIKGVRNELREIAADNMKEFLEGTLRDHDGSVKDEPSVVDSDGKST